MAKNNIDKQYKDLVIDILYNGVEKDTRSGKTLSVFGRTLRHDMSEGFPLLTTKKIHFKSIATELIWFLKGDTNIKYLVDNKVNIWNGDAWKNYQKKTAGAPEAYSDIEQFVSAIRSDEIFAKFWGNLGPVYGKQWRSWDTGRNIAVGAVTNMDGSHNHIEYGREIIDQISNLIHDLKVNPDSRRLMVNAWNVAEIDSMVLPPCHYGFQCYTEELSRKERYRLWFDNNYETGMEYNDEDMSVDFGHPYYEPTPSRRLSLMWNQRSVDTPLGLPYNIASYALLLELLAKQAKMVPGELIANLGDTHIYSNQVEAIKEQIKRVPYELPKLKISNKYVNDINEYLPDDFTLCNYYHHPFINIPLSN